MFFCWYSKIPILAPIKDKMAGNSLYIKGKLNSASIKVILLGCINIELPKKSVPIPTNKSEKIKPKNILNKERTDRGIITDIEASCTFK